MDIWVVNNFSFYFCTYNQRISEEQCKVISTWSDDTIDDEIDYDLMIEEQEFERDEKEEEKKESEEIEEEKEVGVENSESFVNIENREIKKKDIVREDADLRVRVENFKSDDPIHPPVLIKNNEHEHCEEVCRKLVPAPMPTLLEESRGEEE